MNNIKYTIHRYELYGNPVGGRLVAFLITNTDNNRTEYADIVIPIEECVKKSDSEICQLAFERLSDQINKLTESLKSDSNIVGSEFIP